ncbi:MAG: hypothetical protein LBJ22_06065 [Synergistaceae bacterium]|nr:hypothetical protein [Synergistaceae bacterium]
MRMKQKRARRAYALASVTALVFLLTVLMGVLVAHIGYSSDLMDVYLRRVQARSELVSMTNLGLKWLNTQFNTGTRPRAAIAGKHENFEYENLTDFHSLSIFVSHSVTESAEGKVEVFDLDYDPENLSEPLADPLFFPPSLPGGYMVRAAVVQKELASLTIESVYVSVPYDVPETGEVYILKKEPVYWKESFR